MSSAKWRVVVNALCLVGCALLVASAVIHLHLWSGSYGHIPTVGPLFLFQGVAGLLCAGLLAAFRRVVLMALAAVLMVSTAAGLLLSHYAGLFGYKENLAVPYAGMSLVFEFTGTAVLACAILLCSLSRRPLTWVERKEEGRGKSGTGLMSDGKSAPRPTAVASPEPGRG